MKNIWIALFLSFASAEGAELVVNNISRQIQASNDLYESVNMYPEDHVVFQIKQLKNPTAKIYLWLIEGLDAIKTEKPELSWIVSSSLGQKKLQVIAIDDECRIDGSSFQLFIGGFECPNIAITDGARRPDCPLSVRAYVQPYSHALVAADTIQEYHWQVEKEGRILADYSTNTNELEFSLPQDPGTIALRVMAVDKQGSRTPETLFPIEVKPW